EATKYSTFFGMGYSEQFYAIMNLKKWNSLPKDLQKAFDAVAKDAAMEAGQIWDFIQTEGEKYAVKATGHKFLHFSDAEAARIVELLKPIRGSYIKRVTALGLPGEKLANDASKLVQKYNAKKYKPYVP
ncbi:MAG: hypothetical protein JSW15_11975, partial [Deltaproteobacteria bacterium]